MANALPLIYVVDDDPAVRVAVRRLLLSLGLPVRLLGSAEEFLAEADPTLRGCVILDVSLPGMSGVELQNLMAARGWKLPIIFITARDEGDHDAERDAALRRGAVEYLRKPFSCDKLLDSVRLAVGGLPAGGARAD